MAPAMLTRLLCTLSFTVTTALTAQPNVLVIVADDLGYADVGVHGGAEVPTPHLDALAASGVRCSAGYVTAPYCSPSRAGFLTGRAQTRFGHEFNPHVGVHAELGLPLDQKTVANYMKEAGYRTGLVGKWHQGFDEAHHPLSRGFDSYFGFLVGGHNYELHADAKPQFATSHSHDLIYRGRDVQRLDGFATTLFTDEALRFMDEGKERPWFLYLAYNAVHTPLEIDPAVAARVPSSVEDADRRGYLALLIGLDDAVGRIAAHLKEKGQWENTLIFFFSDNGGSGRKRYLAYNTGKNTPLRGDKGQTLEGGIRVPFFVSWPGKLPPGKVYDEPVSTIDILPTSCAVAALPCATEVEGVNLLPYLMGENAAAPHESLFWRFGTQKAVLQGDWKLVISRDFDSRTETPWQLYNLKQDLGEKHDLAAQMPEKIKALQAAWEHWNAKNTAPRWRGSYTEDVATPKPTGKGKGK
jgi:arylsulfatase A-like enzyme